MKIEAAARLQAGANEAMARKYIKSVTKVDSDSLTLVVNAPASIIFTLNDQKNFDKALKNLTVRFGKPEKRTNAEHSLEWHLDEKKSILVDEYGMGNNKFLITLVDADHKADPFAAVKLDYGSSAPTYRSNFQPRLPNKGWGRR